MSETALSTSLLATVLRAVAAQIGDGLPAAFGMEPGDVLVAGDLDTHPMPADAAAVRWSLGTGEATLVIAVTPDAAEMLRVGPPEVSLAEALTSLVTEAVAGLAPLLDGEAPALGEGEEVPADQALAVGPGDAVSLALDDAGTHRATIGMRLVVSDDLMITPAADGMPEVVEVDDPALRMTEEPVGQSLAPAGPSGMAMTEPSRDAVDGIPLVAAASAAPGPGIPLPSESQRRRTQAPRPPAVGPQPQAHPAEFASFDQLTALPSAAHSMAMLGEVEMGVTAELGRTRMTVRDVLALNPGSIVELDRAAGSPVDVVVNGTLIARGEVVVIDEEFGIRITEIMGMAEVHDPFPLQVAQ